VKSEDWNFTLRPQKEIAMSGQKFLGIEAPVPKSTTQLVVTGAYEGMSGRVLLFLSAHTHGAP
jgi:hypothetical protein